MFFTISSILLASSLAAAQTTNLPAGEATILPVIATFPAFGAYKEITGRIEFHPVLSGVEIISTGNEGLHSFPAGIGPFAYHGIFPLAELN